MTNNISIIAEAKKVLPVSDSRYRRLFDSARDGIVILDAHSRKITDANPAMVELLGCVRPADIAGKELREIGLFKDAAECQTAFRDLLENGYVRYDDLTLPNKTGELRRVEFIASVYAENAHQFVQCNIRDITARKHAEEEREQAAQNAVKLAQIAGKAARLGGWTIQLPERVLTWSDENCAIHEVPPGYIPTLEEGIGYYLPEYRAEVTRYVEECAQNGTPYDFELPKYTAKGRLIWARSIGEAVRDDKGNIIGLQGAFQDITVRKQAEQSLRESREQYKQMVEHASDIIYKTDISGRFTFVNPAIIKVLKYTEQEFLTMHYLDVVRQDFRRPVKRFYARQLLKKIPDTSFELIAVAKDGSEVWFGQHAQLFYKDDQIAGFQSICRDITKKKQTEDELLQLSLTDELTGLYNRRGFMALAEHQLKLALNKRIEKKLLVIYLDLDGLKQINDIHGHDEGSRAIIKTAEILRRSFRQSDLVARMGGDEFTVLAIEAEEENTEMILSRLQKNFNDYNALKNHPYNLMFSFGVARFESESRFLIENLLTRADKEMYKQKHFKQTKPSKKRKTSNESAVNVI